MQIVLRTIEDGQEFTVLHDLNFQSEKYEARHPVVRLIPLTIATTMLVNSTTLTIHE